jgi:hypothetical protein
MLFRGHDPEPAVWRRFRAGSDDFTFAQADDHFEAHVVANAERVVDLFHALAEELPPAVDVAIEDARTGQCWRAVNAPLPDVRDSLGRLKVPLAAYGGVEIAVYSPEDQITLTPELDLWIYARTDRWLYLLQGMGLLETPVLRAPQWQLSRSALPPAPELRTALEGAIERLGLQPS